MTKVTKLFLSSLIIVFASPIPGFSNSSFFPESQVLIDFDAVWHFNDEDEDLGEAWHYPDYDDSQWSRGAALLGYDTRGRSNQWPEPGIQSALAENLITYYFRKSFDFSGPIDNQALFIEQIIDDGAVYYLNGIAIARSALIPPGSVNHATRTTGATNPWVEHEVLVVNNPPLRQGRNVLAVSVHNSAANSSYICFGARVTAGANTKSPAALYLTWQRDPTTTMTIHWHTEGAIPSAALQFKAANTGVAETVYADSRPMPFSDRYVHTVELTGLQPDHFIDRAGDRARGR